MEIGEEESRNRNWRMENGVESTVGVTVDWNVVQSQVRERRAECSAVQAD